MAELAQQDHRSPGMPISGVHDLTCRWVCRVVEDVRTGALPWDTKCELKHTCQLCEKENR